jgi:hypothetical protein
MHETWPDLLPRNKHTLWTLASDARDEIALSQCYVQSESTVEAQGFWTSNYTYQVLQTAVFRANILIHI